MSQVQITEATPQDLALALRETSRKLLEAQHEIDGMALLVGQLDRRLDYFRSTLRAISKCGEDAQWMATQALENEHLERP